MYHRGRQRKRREALRDTEGHVVAGTCGCEEIDQKAGEYWVEIWRARPEERMEEAEKAILIAVTEHREAELGKLRPEHFKKYFEKKGGVWCMRVAAQRAESVRLCPGPEP